MALSNHAIKHIQSLRIKKFRQKYHQFIVEGDKAVRELLASSWKIVQIYHTKEFILENSPADLEVITDKEMERISHHQSPQHALAIVQMNDNELDIPINGMHIFLDGIQDPGNLGTIIRIADWYGLKSVFCSPDTVEVYNPKCIDASMGSFLRVKQFYIDGIELVNQCKLPCYAAAMNGQNIHELSLMNNGLILIGNEGKGIRKELLSKEGVIGISIPRFGGAESLNAAVATGIILDNFFRAH